MPMLYKIAAVFVIDGILSMVAAFFAIDVNCKFGVIAFFVGIGLVLIGIQDALVAWIFGV